MTSAVLTIPEDPAAVPGWLERQLLSPDLDRLVAELVVVHRPPDTVPVLDDVLGTSAPAVLARGLSVLPRPALGLLLLNPSLLLELRDLILTDGGSYWDVYLQDEGLIAISNRVAERVRVAVGSAPPAAPRQALPRWVGYAATILATAAAVLVGVYLAGGLRQPEPNRSGPDIATASGEWGFQKIEQLPRDSTDAATLLALADLAGEWGKKTPATPAELLHRLIEFREGCGAIQLSSRLPLSERQARWLKLRCGDWAAEFDRHIRTLEETRDVGAVRAAADRTVAQIVAELKAQA